MAKVSIKSEELTPFGERTVDRNCRVFYIRASNSASMHSNIRA